MIEVQNLSKKFHRNTAVDNISFSVKEGEKLILLGTSGCGKTTTLKMINRLIEPSGGAVFINGQNIMHQQAETLRRNIGYAIQQIGLFPHYTVEQNVGIVPKLLGWNTQKINHRNHELLEMLGLSPAEFLGRYPHELSGGQKQRIGIARALAANPPVLLLDEPFGALDPITRSQIQQEFKKLDSLNSKTVVMVTHDIFEAVELGDTICLMNKGEIQQIGRPAELIFSPKNAFVENFFQAQRFQLELKVMTLKDILPELLQQEADNRNTINFTTDTDLLEILETTAQVNGREPLIRVLDLNKRHILNTNRKAILSAFYQVKQ